MIISQYERRAIAISKHEYLWYLQADTHHGGMSAKCLSINSVWLCDARGYVVQMSGVD
jgi:hypothetical protein